MLVGSVAGGVLAQATNLGVPYVVRAGILVLTFALAFFLMRDLGFTPSPSKQPFKEVRNVVRASFRLGLRRRQLRWVMLTAPFTIGVLAYAFYAMQPYLLELYGDPHAYGIAGLAAAIVAGSQIAGGIVAPHLGKVLRSRTAMLAWGAVAGTFIMAAIGLVHSFWLVVILLSFWGLLLSASFPIRQSYLNALIPSRQRATVLSFDSLLGSGGGVVSQPILGKVADVWSYGASYMVSAVFQACAIPLAWLAYQHRAKHADAFKDDRPSPPSYNN